MQVTWKTLVTFLTIFAAGCSVVNQNSSSTQQTNDLILGHIETNDSNSFDTRPRFLYEGYIPDTETHLNQACILPSNVTLGESRQLPNRLMLENIANFIASVDDNAKTPDYAILRGRSRVRNMVNSTADEVLDIIGPLSSGRESITRLQP